MNFRMIHLRNFVIIYLIIAVLLTHHIQAQQNGDIRLRNNTILEAYLNNKWGAVCDDFWSLANTDVACRELGFRRGDSYHHGIPSDTGIYHLDDVVCFGNESSIIECRYRVGDDCSTLEQVWITCERYGCESFAPFADSVAITVKYYSEVLWYYISAEDFTNENAEVICRENTNRGVESYSHQTKEASSPISIYPYRFRCTGNESSLCECDKSPASITSNLIVKIKCQSSEGKLRLVSGVNENSGYVLINHEDTWKAICTSEEDSNFQLAYVACINLGYKGVYNYYYDNSLVDVINGANYFSTRSRHMNSWLTQPHCNGTEKSVTQCSGSWKDSVCKAIPLWVICEVHEPHDVELRSSTGLQYEGETYIVYNNKRSHLCLPDGVFDSTLGNAICRTIGAPSYQNWRRIESNDAEFLELQYTCFGNEENLASCFSSVLKNRNCEILYLICNPPVAETPRISYGSTEVGLVDIYVGQKWGLSCMSDSGILEEPDAKVICRQLGLSGMGLQTFDYPITEPQNYWNSVYNCLGTESSLAEGNCLQTTGYNSECPISTSVATKIFCRPSKNKLRLNRSTLDINFFRVEFLTPERTWVPVCNAPSAEFCQKFGFNAPDIKRYVPDSAHTYAQLECLSSDVDSCDVNFRYDYNSYYGCGNILEVSCTNLTVPTIKPENIRAQTLSSTSVLLMWDYEFEITETNMFLAYRYELTTSRINYNPANFRAYHWERDHSRISRRYQIFNGLTPYTRYSLNLRLVNPAGFGPNGITVTFTTDETAPTGITINVTIHSIGAYGFTIQWEELSINKRNGLILGYEVCVRVSSSNDVCNSANTERYTPGTTGPFQLQRTGLSPYKEYTVVIRAYNSEGYGPYSPSVSATTDALSPEITQPVVADRYIRITSIIELESFSLNQRCVSTGFPVPTIRWTSNTNVNPSGNVLALRTEDLDLDITNVFTCTATNIGGSDSKTVSILIQIQLSSPAAPTADTVDSTSTRIHWVEYASAVYNISYTVCIRKSVDTSCTQTIHTTRIAISVRNLEASTSYSISITANTVFGVSPKGTSLAITTDDPDPVRPKITTPQQDTSTTITSVVSFESFSLTQSCISTGIPTPAITWTSNTNSNLNVVSDTLTLRTQDLNPEISTNIFTCTSTNTAGRDSKRIRISIDIEPQLTVPQAPTQQSISSNSVDIQWLEYLSSDYVKSYDICVRSTTDTECTQNINTVSTQYSIGSLESATSYRISIVVNTVFGRSPTSVTLTVTTNEPEPVRPDIITPQQDISFVISSVNEFQSFSLVQNCISTGIPVPSIRWTSNTGRIYVVGNVLSIGSSHLRRSTDVDVFTCIATNFVGQDAKQIRIVKSIPLPAAENPTIYSVSANSIAIQWSLYDLVNYVSYYEICVGVPGQNGCRQSIRAYSSPYTIESLLASSQYSITIVVYTNFGVSPRSDALLVTTDPDPVRPEITTPVENISFTINSISNFESFVHTQFCNSTGYPLPTITWTSNTNSNLDVISDTLTIRTRDLDPEISTNIFTCTATNTAGQDSKEIRITIDVESQLTVPQAPTQQSISRNSVDIQWVEYISSDYFNSYDICVRSTINTGCIQTINTVSTEYSIGSLESATSYRISIVVNTVFGRSPTSVTLTVTTNEPEPVQPEITTPQRDVSLTISSVSEFESFSFTQDCVSTGIPTPAITWTSNTNSNLNVVSDTLTLRTQDLNPETSTNIFTCTATNTAGQDSKRIRVTIDIEPQLTTPQAPTQQSIGRNSVDIQWVEYLSSDYVKSYDICVSTTASTGCIQTINTASSQYSIGSLESATSYSISIVVNTVFGRSPTSATLTVTTNEPEPVQPEITTPQQDRSTTITSVASFESFSLTQSCISTGIPTPTITWTSNTNSNLNVVSDTLTLRTQDLNPEISTNIFTCTATNTAGQDSKQIRVTIDIESQLTAPQAPTQQSISSNSVDIQWLEYLSSDYVKSYDICVRSTTNTGCIQTINTVSTQYSIGSLESATAYIIYIVVNTVFGRSPTSVALTVTTNEPESVRPEITSPQQDIHLTISSISGFESFSFSQECISTGVPTPTITWASNTSTLNVVGNRLSIRARHLNKKIVNVFTCTATNSVGRDAKQILIMNTIELSIPAKPAVISISTNSLEIQWSDYDIVDYFIHYEICVSIPGADVCEQKIETSNTQLTIRNLQASSDYSISIVVFTDFGTSPRSSALDIVTADIILFAPRIVVPEQDRQITLTSLNQLERFTLTQECNATGVPEPLIEWTSNGVLYQSDSTLNIQVDDLEGGIDMRFTCTASNIVGSDSRSIEIVTSIRVFPVAKLIVASKGTNYIEIQWIGEFQYSGYDVSYQICLRKSDSVGDCAQKVLSTETKYMFEDLDGGTMYSITIVTITSFGRSLESTTLKVETDPVIVLVDSVQPMINEPSQNLSINMSTIEQLETYSGNWLCSSTGSPEPTIKWTSNTNYLSNDRLIIQPGNFSIDDVVNPYEFKCTAENSAGEDTRLIRIRVDIDLTEQIKNLTNVTSEILKQYTRIIKRNIQGVNNTYEHFYVVREVVDRNADYLSSLVDKYNDTNVDIDVLETILQTGDDIIQVELQQPVEEDKGEVELGKDAVATASEGVIKTLNTIETVALGLLSNIPGNETISVSISSPSITMVAENHVLPTAAEEEEEGMDKLIIPDATVVKEREVKERIQIPLKVARTLAKNNTNLRIATTIVKNDVKPKPEDSDKKVSKLSSSIVSVVVAGYESTKMTNFPQPVRFIFPVPATDSSIQFQNCSHLNSSSWSTSGLTTNATDNNITFCDSDHFTSFAVFVTPREIPDDDLSRIASIVSYVLVSISFIALIISLVLFLLSGKNFFKVEANIIYFNYCLAMTLAFGLFLFGIESGKFHIIMCMVIAFLLHYIWLAVFIWTLCNGILIMYKLTIGILREHKIYPYLIVFGWSSPLIIPIITIAIKHKNYVNPEQHCFITHEDGLIWSFIGPILVILLINLIILAFATIRIATTKFGTEKIDEKQALRKGILSLLILTPLLGIPWLLLLLNIFISDPIVQWSFILINGLMGVFFFLAITLRNTEVKKLFAKSTKEQSTSFSDSKTSGMLSRKFKRSISKDSGECVQSPTGGPPGKGEYIPLDPVFEDSASLKSPTTGGPSRYDAPPVPRNLPKARKLSKDSSESEEPTHYDVPKNVRPINVYSGDYDVLKQKPESPIYAELREENMIPEFENKPEIKSTKLSEKKLYQTLDSSP